MAAPLMDPEAEAKRREKQREYMDFLDDAGDEGVYSEKIRALVTERRCRLIVNINDLRRKYPGRTKGLLSNESFEEVICFQAALKDIVSNFDPQYSKEKEEFYVGFEGSFGHRHVNPRTLKAHYIGNLVCCEGIVTKCSLVRPKVVRSVHYCPATGKTHERRYTDLTSYDAFPSSTVYPTEDENRNPLETEYGLSVYKDHQTFSIQELPEMAPAGQLPRSLDIVSDNDLADQCKPGDRVRVIGVFRCLPSKQNGFTSGAFRTILIGNNIQLMSKEAGSATGSAEMKLVSKFRRMKIDHFEVLARSLAPSIHGHEEVKMAILSMLLGGQEKILPNGTRLRGDINILLIGDPSVAKSQLLRYVLYSAPRAIATTGRGSSGVGLTAAVTSDSESGERRLEAGAMVLADRGIVCIDEFDKMSDIDRTAIHEVMEQGRVTIAKAGIHAKLNARCAVLAAANPVYGRYDIYKSPMENIGMQDSLLSRFDLCFVLLDEHKADRDRAIAEHVIRIHQYRKPGEDAGTVTDMGPGIEGLTTLDLNQEDEETEIFQNKEAWSAGERTEKLVTVQFMRKYLSVAKECKPALTPEAASFIADKYADLRDFDEKKSDRERTTPVTARMLETMIRLATAHAKARMSVSITKKDAERAFELLYFACFKEKPKERLDEEAAGKRPRRTEADENEEMESDEVIVRRTTQSRRAAETEDDENSEIAGPTAKRARREPATISTERYKTWRTHLRAVFDAKHSEMLNMREVIGGIQGKVSATLQFSESEVEAAFSRMADENIAMVDDDENVIII